MPKLPSPDIFAHEYYLANYLCARGAPIQLTQLTHNTVVLRVHLNFLRLLPEGPQYCS